MIHTFHYFFLLRKSFIGEVEINKTHNLYFCSNLKSVFPLKIKNTKKIQVNVMEIVKSGISNDSALLKQIIDPVGRRQINFFRR